MNEDDDARLARAAMKSLHVPAPESLRAELKRLARKRKPAPSLWERLRLLAEGESTWAYGAGAAFAAAGLGVLLLRPAPGRTPDAAPAVAARPAQRIETAPPQALADMWADDDGGDDDEI